MLLAEPARRMQYQTMKDKKPRRTYTGSLLFEIIFYLVVMLVMGVSFALWA